MHRLIPLALLLVCGLNAFAMGPQAGARLSNETLETTIPLVMRYLAYVPPEYDQQEAWPLLLFLHGAGERGDNLEQVKVHGPAKLIEAGKDLPMVVICPQCPSGERWRANALDALLDDIVERYKIDPNRIYVTGLSMGGFGTWDLAAREPNRLAAIVPICGGGERFWAEQLKDLPIWAFHGDADDVVPLARSQELVEEIKRLGGSPKFTVYPDVGHDSWTATYENPEMWEWLLQQKREDGGGSDTP